MFIDIFGNPIKECKTVIEELEEVYGETIDYISESDGDE